MQNLKNTHKAQPANTVPKLRLTYLQAINSATKQVVLSESEGMVCGENTGVFPPCYPIILAGEVIDEKVIKILSSAKCTFGITDGKIKVIK